MFRHWLKNQSAIENFRKKIRKNRKHNVDCQKSEMKTRLIEMFVETKKIEKKMTNRWFMRHAKNIYEQLHFHRIIKRFEKIIEYTDFKFFFDWFQNFKKREKICVRIFTKMSQAIRSFFYWIFLINRTLILHQISKNFCDRIVSWLQFNCRNFQFFFNQSPLHENEKYRLCDINNMNQILIVYEFFQKHFYDFKKTKTIWMKIHRSGWNYKQTILMLYVFADEINRCKPFIILKKKNAPKNSIIRKKMMKYDSDVIVQWNSKAYCNAQVMINWLQNQYQYAIIGLHNFIIKRLLFLNVFTGQKTSEVSILIIKLYLCLLIIC